MRDWDKTSKVIITFNETDGGQHDIVVKQTDIPSHDKFGALINIDALK